MLQSGSDFILYMFIMRAFRCKKT